MRLFILFHLLLLITLAQTSTDINKLQKENAALKEEIAAMKMQQQKILEMFDAPKIVVVDISEIFRCYQKSIDMKNDIHNNYKQETLLIKKEFEKWEQLNTLLNSRPLYKLTKQKVKVEEQELKLQMQQEYANRILYKKLRDLSLLIHDEIALEIRRYAQKNDIDIVLKIDHIDATKETHEEIYEQIGNKKVLYYSNKRDITAQIIAQLNNSYTKQQTKDKIQGKHDDKK